MIEAGVAEGASPGRYRVSWAMTFETAPVLAATDWSTVDAERVCVDLSGIGHVDSAGVAVLVDWLATAGYHGRSLTFEGAPPQLVAIARVSGVDILLGLSDDAGGPHPTNNGV